MHEKLYEELNVYLRDTLFYDDLPGLVISAGYIEDSESPVESEAHQPHALKTATLKRKLIGFQYKNGAGYSDITDKTPLTAEHIFHMVSVSKLFTGMSILILSHRGVLSLDDKIAEILPSTYIDDIRYKDVTLRRMLSHTSGIPDVDDYEWDNPRWDEAALDDYALSPDIKKLHLLWGPEEGRFCYSNIAFELLGLAVEKLSGMSYEAFVAENIFAPLGMNSSNMFTPGRIAGFEADFGGLSAESCRIGQEYGKADFLLRELKNAGLAMPHVKDEQRHIVKARCYPYNRCHAPSSTLTTNAADMGKFAEGILNHRLLAESEFKEIWTEQAAIPGTREKMGLGWFIRRQHGYEIYGHEGTDIGFRAAFWVCPELRLYICISSNITSAPMKKIAKKVFDIILDNIK